MGNCELKKVLVLDDNSDYRKLLLSHLTKLLPAVIFVEYCPLTQGIPDEAFNWSEFDVLILDYNLHLEDFTGLDLLGKYRYKEGFPATVMLTGVGNEELAVRSVDFGIHRYLNKKGLTRRKIKEAIIDSWAEYNEVEKKRKEATQHNKSFSKELFYLKLAQPLGIDGKGTKKMLLIMVAQTSEMDKKIEPSLLSFHIAKRAFEFFKHSNNISTITLTGKNEMGLLINSIADQDLSSVMDKLFNYIKAKPFFFGNDELNFSLSVGIFLLAQRQYRIEEILKKTRAAYLVAAKDIYHDSFHLCPRDISLEQQTQVLSRSVKQSDAAVEKKADAFGGLDLSLRPIDDIGQRPSFAGDSLFDGCDDYNVILEKAMGRQQLTQSYRPAMGESVPKQKGDLNSERIFEAILRITDFPRPAVDIYNINEYAIDFSLEKKIAQWMFRQLICTIAWGERALKYSCMLKMNNAWLADYGLLEWARKMIKQTNLNYIGAHILFEISVDQIVKFKKNALPIIRSLHEQNKFRIIISGLSESNIDNIVTQIPVEYLAFPKEIILQLAQKKVMTVGSKAGSRIDALKSSGYKIIATDIDNATMLGQMIAAGANLFTGRFVGMPQNTIGEILSKESFRLT